MALRAGGGGGWRDHPEQVCYLSWQQLLGFECLGGRGGLQSDGLCSPSDGPRDGPLGPFSRKLKRLFCNVTDVYEIIFKAPACGRIIITTQDRIMEVHFVAVS